MIWDEDAYLLVDNSLIAEEENTSFVREEAYKCDHNPIIDENRKEFFLGEKGYRIWIQNVCWHEGKYRMRYSFMLDKDRDVIAGISHRADTIHMGYAESDDGYDFKPVTVGLVEHNGLRDNNLAPLFEREGCHCCDLFCDPLDTEYPFKTVVLVHPDIEQINPALRARWPHVDQQGACDMGVAWGIARSRDGFTWEAPENEGLLVDMWIENPVLHRALDGGLVISNQGPLCNEEGSRRVKGWLTYDGTKSYRIPDALFEIPPLVTRVTAPQLGPAWHGTAWTQSHVRLVPARKGPSTVALHGFLYGCMGAETYAQTADIGLAVSSTGYGFQQVWPFRPFIGRADRGKWDAGLVGQQAMVETEDQTLFYYVASPTGNAAGCEYRPGIAYIDKDRFGYRGIRVMRGYKDGAIERQGMLKLKPLTLPGSPALSANVTHVNTDRTVSAEVRDTDGAVIPGFSFADCVPITEPGLRQPLAFRNADLKSLAGETVNLSIKLYSPDCLYGDQHSPRLYAIYTR